MPSIISEDQPAVINNSRLIAPAAPAKNTELAQVSKGFMMCDTLSACSAHKNESVSIGARPKLPPGQSKDPSVLAILAHAFEHAFNAMSKGITTQATDYAEVQQLDQTMAQSILESTTNAINKEVKELHAEEQLASEMKKASLLSEIFGGWVGTGAQWIDDNVFGGVVPHKDLKWVILGIGAALMIVTIASSFFDGGASLAAVPEEAALLDVDAGVDATTFGAEVFGEGSDTIPLDTFSSSVTDDAAGSSIEIGDITSEASGEFSEAEISATEEDTVTTETDQTVTRDLDKTTNENAKGESIWKKLFKKCLQGVVGATLASPMLVNGVMSLGVSDKLGDVSNAQKEVGAAVALMQENNMFFQFYQQLVRRSGSVIEEEANDASEIVETIGAVFNAYKQISYGLAQAV